MTGHDRADAAAVGTDGPRAFPHGLAVALVAGTSGAVLVFEILAIRVLAPYVGVNLETYTAIIGTILAGIALGAWLGGVAADTFDPRSLVPLLLVIGGGLGMASIPIVRALGGDTGPGSTGAPSVLLALWGFGPSAAVLSAVPPAVVKLQLRDLARTGATVGRLSAWGTAGAIGGTFLAGYVLVAFAAVTTLIVAVGALVASSGVALWAVERIAPAHLMAIALAGSVVAGVGAVALGAPCDVQTTYYCVSIVPDPERPSGRRLILDDLSHSYVDLDDPAHLEFWYVRRIADAIDAYAPPGPIDVVSIGGGAMTVPRWVEVERPGSSNTVLELDGGLVEVIEAEFGLPDARIVVGDGRLGLRELPDATADVIVGDAFGSRSVPWHLATQEVLLDVRRVLRPDGVYVLNLIDGGGEDFLRAEAATLATVFDTVLVLRGPFVVDGRVGNSVVVAGAADLDVDRWVGPPGDERAEGGRLVGDLAAYLDGALVLTDDFAPVDQLIAGTR